MSNLTLEECLNAEVTEWDKLELRNHGFAVDTIMYSALRNGIRIEITRQDLDAINPHLAGVLDYQMRKTYRLTHTEVSAIIAASLHYWHRPRLMVTTPPGDEHRSPRFFVSISNIRGDPESSDGFLFTGSTFKVRHRAIDGVLGACRIKSGIETYMSGASLDAQYPGSSARLSMGLAIGLNASELAHQITGANAIDELSLQPYFLDSEITL